MRQSVTEAALAPEDIATADPCGLVPPVKQFRELRGRTFHPRNPCGLVPRVKQFRKLRGRTFHPRNPCGLVPRVKQFRKLRVGPCLWRRVGDGR